MSEYTSSSLTRLACSKTAPSSLSLPNRGWAVRVKAETKVASIAICAPPYTGNESAITSIRRVSLELTLGTLRFLTKTFSLTRAPPSRQMRAIIRSIGRDLRLSLPEDGQAARWSPR
eukprot:3149145-Karenia_brevis.AAC.1